MELNQEDKRIFQRFDVSVPVKLLNLNSNTEAEAFASDISAKGLGIRTTWQMAPYSILEMWLKTTDKTEPYYTRGKVVWSSQDGDGYRVGINLERADLIGVSRVMRCSQKGSFDRE